MLKCFLIFGQLYMSDGSPETVSNSAFFSRFAVETCGFGAKRPCLRAYSFTEFNVTFDLPKEDAGAHVVDILRRCEAQAVAEAEAAETKPAKP